MVTGGIREGRRLALLTVAVTALLLTAAPVRSQITGATSSTVGATCSGGGSSEGDCRNSTSLPVNNGTTLKSRYAWNINADTVPLSTHDTSGNAQHNISFTATAPGGYRLDITTQRVGDLNLVNDITACDGSADTGGVTGSSNIALDSGSLSLDDPGVIGNTGTTQDIPFNQSSSATIFRVSNGAGQSHSLTFTWTGSVRSNSCEAAVRQGESSGTTSGCSACGYPGSPSRTQSTDGHFVTVSFTSLCGNGTVDASVSEQCDEGASNGSSTVCCTSTCQFQPSGTPCTGGTCDDSGNCVPATTTTTTSVTTTSASTTTSLATTTTTTLPPGIGHTKCYKVKDPRAKATYTMDLVAGVPGFVNEQGCTLKLGAKRVCVPPPGGGPVPGPNAGAAFFSYKVKCPKQTIAPVALQDQFGTGLFTVGAANGLLVPALPGPPGDHYKCYKTKDPRPKAAYLMDLMAGPSGFLDEQGCMLKLPGKGVCVQVTKQNVSPPPPGGGPAPGPNAGAKFILYKLKCPKQVVGAGSFADQFGPTSLTPGKASLLLVPAGP